MHLDNAAAPLHQQLHPHSPTNADRQIDGLAGRQADRHADRLAGQPTGKQSDRQIDRQVNRQTGRQADTKRETVRKTDRHVKRQEAFVFLPVCLVFHPSPQDLQFAVFR